MSEKKEYKGVVWDLDNTLWDGVLVASSSVQRKQGIRVIIETLDRRGILQTINSTTDYPLPMY
ncbi:hypothetical protein KW823_24235, partial [Enterobacter quasiroggenkampii]|nr:hypothetical protein [Enterobacter quasiroggenkampii]